MMMENNIIIPEDLTAYEFKVQLVNLLANTTTLSPLRKYEIFESIGKDLQIQVEKDLNKQIEEYKASMQNQETDKNNLNENNNLKEISE